MNALTKLKYIKELAEYVKQDIKSLPLRQKLAAIKRMRELILLLNGEVLANQSQKEKEAQTAETETPQPTVETPETSQGTTSNENSRDADMEFLQKVMKGEIEPSDQSLDRMNSLVQKYESDDEMNNMITQALNVWLEALLSDVSGSM